MRPGCLLPCFVSPCALVRFQMTSPPQLQQPDGHHDQVGLHAGAVDDARRVDARVDARLTLRNLPVPCLIPRRTASRCP